MATTSLFPPAPGLTRSRAQTSTGSALMPSRRPSTPGGRAGHCTPWRGARQCTPRAEGCSADVGELDNNGIRGLAEVPEVNEVVGDALEGLWLLWKRGEHAACHGNAVRHDD